MILAPMHGAALSGAADVLRLLLNDLTPVPPVRIALADALGRIGASGLTSRAGQPSRDEAILAGYAVSALDLVGASAYAPAILGAHPPFLAAGAPLPPGADSVVDARAVTLTGPFAEMHVESVPGEGVRPRGADVAAGTAITEAGQPVSPFELLMLEREGIAEIEIRSPTLLICAKACPEARLLARLAEADGATVHHGPIPLDAATLRATLDDTKADLVAILDADELAPGNAVAALAAAGDVLATGVAIRPGRDTAIGRIDRVPLFVLPAAPDEAVGAYLLLLRTVLDHLADRAPRLRQARPLTGKIASSPGIRELVLLASDQGGWHPLAIGSAPLSLLARADAWMRIKADSEGFAEGTLVEGILLP